MMEPEPNFQHAQFHGNTLTPTFQPQIQQHTDTDIPAGFHSNYNSQ